MAHPHAIQTTLDYARTKNFESRLKVERAFLKYPSPPPFWSTLDLATSNLRIDGFLPMSNFAVRFAAQRSLVEALLAHYDRTRADPTIRHFLATIAVDDGFSFEDSPVLATARLKLKVRRLFTEYGLQAICAFDLDVLSRTSGAELSRRLCLHVHAVVWTRDPKFRPKATGKKLSGLPQWSNLLDIPGVNFRSRAESNAYWRNDHGGVNDDPRFKHPGRDQTARSIAWLAYYLLKPDLYCKNPIHLENSRHRMRTDEGAFWLSTALRCVERWSHFSPGDTLFAVGPEGTQIAIEVAANLRSWAGKPRPCRRPELERPPVERAWDRFYDLYPELGGTTSILR